MISIPSSHRYPVISTSLVALSYFQRDGDLFIGGLAYCWEPLILMYFNSALSSGAPATQNVFEVKLQHFNFLEDFYSSLENWCDTSTDRLAGLDLTSLRKRYQTLPKLNDPTIRLEGPLIVNGDLHVSGKLSAKSVSVTWPGL